MPLTDTSCKNAKPAEKPRKISDSQGLYLEIMPNGSKYWRLKYRFIGKEKRLALGIYPETTLANAREKRDHARKLLANGIDPSQDRKNQKLQSSLNAANNFKAIAIEWHEQQKPCWSPAYAVHVLNRLSTDIFPVIGYLPIADITAPQILSALRQIEKRGAHEIAKRMMQTCGQVFRYAIATGRAERNPASDLKGALQRTPHGHYAALEANDLPAFLQTLDKNDARLYLHTRLAVKLLMLTFVRTGELIAATWDEINFDEKRWVIPAARMKMRKDHIVPLSKQAIAILQELKNYQVNSQWVFPSQTSQRKHMTNNTILKALEPMGYKGQATGHGFRALAMTTIKERLNYRHEVVDRQLAHAPRNKVEAAYDRASFIDERTKMMQHWADYLDAVASTGKVITGNFGQVA